MGIIETFQINIGLLNRERTIRVYLPDNYYFEKTRYPVLYMHDGHNLFSSETSGYGISWDVHLLLDEYEKMNNKNIILVGIDCDKVHRFDEYSPWKSKKIKEFYISNGWLRNLFQLSINVIVQKGLTFWLAHRWEHS